MPIVVADTSPLRYLVEIGPVDLLPILFHKILIPVPVHDELRCSGAPASVRQWAGSPPSWLEILPEPPSQDPGLRALDGGEKAALALGIFLNASLILIDERKAAAAAVHRVFEVTGTLGFLARAAQLGLIDLDRALDRLKGTNFRCRPEMLDELLAKHKKL